MYIKLMRHKTRNRKWGNPPWELRGKQSKIKESPGLPVYQCIISFENMYMKTFSLIFYATNFVKWIPIKHREILVIIRNSPDAARSKKKKSRIDRTKNNKNKGDKKERNWKGCNQRMTMRMMVLEWIHIFWVCMWFDAILLKKTETMRGNTWRQDL